ncbi:hypothetical protein DYB30_005532 [Aphanomyces astaci]|uniref:START domain-containing protein n=1 Tax=Aphanomyces astaci TaxID=112090 RepID=A0A397CCB3_APHAT|nr:hypothetical protein DYB30_005532 [Aphanomyces astaci]
MTDDDILERLLFGGGDDFMTSLTDSFPFGASQATTAPSTDATTVPDGSSTVSDESDAPKRKRQRTSLKHELEYLREKQDVLQAQLNELRATTIVRPPSSIWETRAKVQMAAATRAMHENASLRTILQEQLKTAQTLERVLKKSPKLELSPQFNRDEWRSWRLGADPSTRVHSMLAITDHLYERLECELIKNNVYDLQDGQSSMNVRTHQNVLWFDFMQSSLMHADLDAMRRATWALIRQQIQVPGGPVLTTTGSVRTSMYLPDHNIVYTHNESTVKLQGGTLCKSEGRWIARMYSEPNRAVVVYRSILDDALEPHTPGRLRDNLMGWVVLQRCEIDPSKTRHMVVHQCPPAVMSEGGESSPPTGEMTEFLLNMLRSHMDRIKQAVIQHDPTSSSIQANHDVKLEQN